MFVCPECGAPGQAPDVCPTDRTPLQPIGDDLLLGTTIGAYRVARLLGIGGMGRVYKGVHPTIGSRVAIKVLSRECTDRRELVDRFFSEAKAVNLIRHESIVNVLDLSTLPDGRPFIIMEYLDGAPLASIIEHAVSTRTPLPLGGLARLAVEVLDALGAAHAKGIVHRDLKPDNIFVTPSGRPKVLDFGIAKLNDMTTGSATRTGSLLGTPHYMSPEQAAGKPADHRADIYAIGVILYECVTGAKPFVAESLFDLLRMHIETPPPSPRSLRPDLSSDFEQVILTALGKSPDHRFASAHAMSVALQHATAQLAAEQWTPITGTGSHRGVPSAAWQHTPPQMWSSSTSGGPHGARESVQPPNLLPPPHIGQQSTVSASAGQLQAVPDPKRTTAKKQPSSKKVVWLAAGATLLAGAGITAAVVAGGGGERTTTTTVAKPTDPPPPPTGGEDDSDDEMPEPTERADIDIGKGLEELDKLDERLGKLEEAGRQLEETFKPPGRDAKQRPGRQPLAEAESPADTKSTTTPPLPPPPPSKGTIWDDAYAPGPFKFSAKSVDVAAFIKYAVAEAKRADPGGGALYRIDIDGVHPDGTADLTLGTMASSHGSIDLRFVNHVRGKRDPKLPVGASHKETQECQFRIMLEPSGVEARTMFKAITEAGLCIKQIPIPTPRCSVKQIWQKAIAKGAPATGAVADLGYRAPFKGKPVWYFDIGSGMDKVFSSTFTDDC